MDCRSSWFVVRARLGVCAGVWTLAACSSSTGTSTTSVETAGDGGSPSSSQPAATSTADAAPTPVSFPIIDAGSSQTPATTLPTQTEPVCGGFGSSDATCNACTQSTCCAAGSACGANAACQALFACIQLCAQGDTACVGTCESDNPSGETALTNFINCLADDCKMACGGGAAAGIGDPCQQNTDCLSGSCNGAWCTTTCTADTDCESTTQSITNSAGELVWCAPTSAGDYCFPGCSSNADCTGFGAGVECITATVTNGSASKICSVPQ
jgi:hypothetical protein